MNRLKRKLTSQTGASITYALLLFLVCAVVSSVVLAAGTAASGRISKSVESDQRYYSVTSAVQLLKKQIDDGKSDIIVCAGKLNDDGEVVLDSDKISSATFNGGTLLDQQSIKEFGSSVAGGLRDSLLTNGKYTQTLTLAVSTEGFSDETKKALEVLVKQTITVGDFPTMTLDVYNKDGTNGIYTLRLTFTADVEDSVGKKKTNGTISYTVTRKVTWNYYSIETVAATTTTPGGGS